MKTQVYNQPAIATFQRQHTVRWIETDASGTVPIPSLIRMMEETEYAFLRSRDLCVVLRDDKGVFGFPRLSTTISVEMPVVFEDQLTITLHLMVVDGKEILYVFEIQNDAQQIVATAEFRVATCRFPRGDWPYAILTPEFVTEKLTQK